MYEQIVALHASLSAIESLFTITIREPLCRACNPKPGTVYQYILPCTANHF